MKNKTEDPLLKNYLMLLQAIIFSNYDDAKGYAVAVYDTKENDRLVAIFNNYSLCARFFDSSKEVISCNSCRNNLLNCRFRIERFECETTVTKAEAYQIINSESNRKYFDKYRGYKKLF